MNPAPVLSFHSRTRSLVFIAVFAALTAVGAFIRIPVPVCPFTLQLLFTTLAGLLLGRFRGGCAVGLYVLLGLAGLPVFTEGGGPAYIFQPTFGYLPGFILGTMVTGYIAEHLHTPTIKQLILADISGLFFVYLCGMVYLYLITTVYMGQPMTLRSLFLYCFFLAVPGDICLCIIAAILAKKLKHHGFSI